MRSEDLNSKVAVTGIGVVSPAGIGFEEFGNSLKRATVHTSQIDQYSDEIGTMRGAILRERVIYKI